MNKRLCDAGPIENDTREKNHTDTYATHVNDNWCAIKGPNMNTLWLRACDKARVLWASATQVARDTI